MRRTKKRLNELLLDYGLIKEKDVIKALDIQRQTGAQLATILIEEGYVKEEDIVTCFCRYLDIPPISLAKFKSDEAIIKIIPEHVARHYRLVCVSQMGNMLTVAMSDPLNVLAVDDIKALTGYDVIPVVSCLSEITEAVDRFYHHKAEAKKKRFL
ncbi:MAG: hypothetical protein L6416_11740 [Candidatus Omnitrophica bacterium]|nr:hypothetical protein [Candidatus Omnitrophota bacterium]